MFSSSVEMAKLLVTVHVVLTILCFIPLFATRTNPAGMYVCACTSLHMYTWFSSLLLGWDSVNKKCTYIYRDLNLLDRKWVRTWCRMCDIGINMLNRYPLMYFLVADSHIRNAKCNKSNYCHVLQFEPAITHYVTRKPQFFEVFIFAVQG